MTAREPTRQDDESILTMLDLRAHEGLSMSEIGKRLGVSKSAVAGRFHRVRHEEVTDCTCTKPENKDGALGRFWWLK